MKSARMVICALALAALSARPAIAQVVNSADVAGLRTFQDVNTGRIWLDLDDFFNASANDMFAVAASAGFTTANAADLNQLFSGLPLGNGQWSSYAAVMGSAPNREIMWAAFDVNGGADAIPWAYAYNGGDWIIDGPSYDPNSVPNGNSDQADMNLWAYQAAVVTPEPASLVLLATGLVSIGAVVRRKRNRIA